MSTRKVDTIAVVTIEQREDPPVTTYQSLLDKPNNYQQFKSNKGKINFALKEAEEFLKFIDSANETITSRSATALGISVSTMTALVIHGLSGGLVGGPDPLKIASLVTALVFYAVSQRLCKNLATQNTSTLGSMPDDLINQKTCRVEFSLEDIKIVQIKNAQDKITKAMSVNERKAANLNESLTLSFRAPPDLCACLCLGTSYSLGILPDF